MFTKINKKLDNIIRKMQLNEFMLNVYLVLITFGIIVLSVTLAISHDYGTELIRTVAVIVCVFSLYLHNKYKSTKAISIFTLFFLNGFVIPVIVFFCHRGFHIAIMGFVANMVMIYMLFEGFLFYLIMMIGIFEYTYMFADIVFGKAGFLRPGDFTASVFDVSSAFVVTVLFMISIIHIQGRYFRYELSKIKSNSEIIMNADTAKSQFLSNMSYEIRTPMNIIVNLSEILLKEAKDDETRSAMNTIKSASYDLLSIIDDVLTFAKIDAGDMKLVEEEYEFVKFIDSIARATSEAIQKKDLNLSIKIDHEIPKVLYGDSVIIRQIFLYLMFISIETTASERINLEINCKKDENNQIATFICKISDTGRGLSEVDIRSLFGIYDTYDSRQSSNLKGIGLKFSICKELLALMDGTIKVESIEDVGLSTTFTFKNRIIDNSEMIVLEDADKPAVLVYTNDDMEISKWQNIMSGFSIIPTYARNFYAFNRAIQDKHFDFIFVPDENYAKLSNVISIYQCEEQTYILSDPKAIYGDFDKCRLLHRPFSIISVSKILNHQWNKEDYKRNTSEELFIAPKAQILVVDDNAVNLKVASSIFKKYGIEIAVATSGEESLKKIAENRYDVIFMDIVMPNMNGDEALIKLREMDDIYFKQVPVIALTAQSGAEVRSEMTQKGFQDFLVKPIKRRYLEKCLLEFLPQEFIEKVKSEASDQDKEKKAKATKSVQSGLNVDKGLLNIGFDKDAYAAILNTYYAEGIKYIDQLPKLLEVGDIQLFTTNVHGIKSSSASIGAMEVSGLFRELEMEGKAGKVPEINSHFDAYLEKFKEILGIVKEYLIHENQFIDPTATIDLANQETEELHVEVLTDLKTELDKMNLKVTDEKVPELASKNYGSELNDKIKKMKDAYDMFDFHQVKAILNELIEKLS